MNNGGKIYRTTQTKENGKNEKIHHICMTEKGKVLTTTSEEDVGHNRDFSIQRISFIITRLIDERNIT